MSTLAAQLRRGEVDAGAVMTERYQKLYKVHGKPDFKTGLYEDGAPLLEKEPGSS